MQKALMLESLWVLPSTAQHPQASEKAAKTTLLELCL